MCVYTHTQTAGQLQSFWKLLRNTRNSTMSLTYTKDHENNYKLLLISMPMIHHNDSFKADSHNAPKTQVINHFPQQHRCRLQQKYQVWNLAQEEQQAQCQPKQSCQTLFSSYIQISYKCWSSIPVDRESNLRI